MYIVGLLSGYSSMSLCQKGTKNQRWLIIVNKKGLYKLLTVAFRSARLMIAKCFYKYAMMISGFSITASSCRSAFDLSALMALQP
jgi:hypothetical protein